MRARSKNSKYPGKPSMRASVALLLGASLINLITPVAALADTAYSAPPGSFVGATQNDQFVPQNQQPQVNPSFQNSVPPVNNYYNQTPQNFSTPGQPVNNYGYPTGGAQGFSPQPNNNFATPQTGAGQYGQNNPYAVPSGYQGQPYDQTQQGSVQQNQFTPQAQQPAGAIQPFAQSQVNQSQKPDGWPSDFPDNVSSGQTTVDNSVAPLQDTSQSSGSTGGGGASMAAGIGKALLSTVGSVMMARSMYGNGYGMGGYGSPYGMGGYGMGGYGSGYGSGGLANTALRMFTGGNSYGMGGYGSPYGMGGYGMPYGMSGYGSPYGGGMMNSLMNTMLRH